jgi:diguanylate cyclase (GGDEF)-like protein
MLSARAAANIRSVFGDALIVGLGAWLISWVALIRPTISHNPGRSLGDAILTGAYQPAGTVVLFLLVLLLFSGSGTRQASVWLVTVAMAFNLAADVLWGLVSAGTLGVGVEHISMALYVAAYFTAAGAFIHPTVVWLKRAVDEPVNNRVFGRLILTTSSLIIPIIALASTGPHGYLDKVVRSVSALVLAGAVTLRVTQAVRANGRTQANLRLSAQTDALTHFPNRTLLLERINDCLRMAWQSDSHPTLYFVDLDRFKNINDSLGHAAGDEVLKMVAIRLSKAAPEHSTVARLSGDEYVVLDPSTRSPGSSLALAERLLSIFREPLPISQGDVFVTASIGVASLSPSSSSSAEDLLRHADTAMYRAKDAGRNCLGRLRRVDARACRPPPVRRDRPLPGPRSPRAPAVPPTDPRSRIRRRRRLRSADALAAGRRHHRVARRVHPDRRRHGNHRAHRFLGAARSTHAVATVDRRRRVRRGGDDVGQRLATAVERSQLPVDRQRGAHPLGRLAAAAVAGGHRRA